MAIPVLDFKKFRDSQVRALRTGMGGGTIPGAFKGPDPNADGRALVEIGTEGNIVSVPHGGGVFPVGGEVLVQVNDDLVPTGLLAGGSAAGGETVALGATGEAIQAQGDKLGKSLEDMSARVRAAAGGPVDTGRLTAGEVLIKGDLIAGDTIGARHIVASEELEAKMASFRKVTTDELVAGKAKIGGSLIADTLEGKTLRGSSIEGGRINITPDNPYNVGLRVGTLWNKSPFILFGTEENESLEEFADACFSVGITDFTGDGRGYSPTVAMAAKSGRGGNEVRYLCTIMPRGVWGRDDKGKTFDFSWEDIAKTVKAGKESPVSFGDLDRDWKREPRPYELVKTGSIVDLFGGEWVRQNSEWDYTGNTWFNWGFVPEGYRPKQTVHFTVVITEDNFPHFAQGQIRPDGTFGLKLDRGIRVKPNVSRIMVPPLRWHL